MPLADLLYFTTTESLER